MLQAPVIPLYRRVPCLLVRRSASYSYSYSHERCRRSSFSYGISSSAASDHENGSVEEDLEGGRRIKVSVWWDFENCNVPAGVSGISICPRIIGALRTTRVNGPVSIHAYGDVSQLSRSTLEGLRDTGVYLFHVPSDGAGGADRAILVDLVFWATQNPPPAHILLISGDGDFSNVLHRLRMKNYNILLACKGNSPQSLCSAASIVWEWQSLIRGIGMLGRQINYPPDGTPNSWYQEVLDDLDSQGSSADIVKAFGMSQRVSDNESKEHIPISLKKQIADILCLHPNGLSLNELRSEMVSKGIDVDTKHYGYKRFRNFLLAMPDILIIKRHALNGGKYWPYTVFPRKKGIYRIKSLSSFSESPGPNDRQKELHTTVNQSQEESSGSTFLNWLLGIWKKPTS